MTTTGNSLGVDWHHPAGSASRDGDPVVVTPEDAGWAYCGLRVVRLGPGETRELATGPDEVAVLPLAGGVRVETEGRSFRLAGRDSVFARVTDWAYVPIDAELRLSSDAGAEVALPSARATRRFDPVRVDAASRSRRDPRRRARHAAGHELHGARCLRRGRPAHVRRAAHA